MSFDHNGQLSPHVEPPSTGRMWADMFGFGEFFRVLRDPQFMTHVQMMMSAVMEEAAAMRRIEAMTQENNAMLRRLLEDHDGGHPRPELAPLFAPHGSNGVGGHPPTGVAVDDGSAGSAGDDFQAHGRIVGAAD